MLYLAFSIVTLIPPILKKKMTLPLTLDPQETLETLDPQETKNPESLPMIDSLELKDLIALSPEFKTAKDNKTSLTIKASDLKGKFPLLASLGDMPLFAYYFKDGGSVTASLGVYRYSESDPSLCLAIPDLNWAIPNPDLLSLSHFVVSKDGILAILKNPSFLMSVPLKGKGVNETTRNMIEDGEIEMGDLLPSKLPYSLVREVSYKPVVYHPMSDLLEGNVYKILSVSDKSYTVEGLKPLHYIENLTPSALLKKAKQGDKFKVLAIVDAPPYKDKKGKLQKRKTAMIEFI